MEKMSRWEFTRSISSIQMTHSGWTAVMLVGLEWPRVLMQRGPLPVFTADGLSQCALAGEGKWVMRRPRSPWN